MKVQAVNHSTRLLPKLIDGQHEAINVDCCLLIHSSASLQVSLSLSLYDRAYELPYFSKNRGKQKTEQDTC